MARALDQDVVSVATPVAVSAAYGLVVTGVFAPEAFEDGGVDVAAVCPVEREARDVLAGPHGLRPGQSAGISMAGAG